MLEYIVELGGDFPKECTSQHNAHLLQIFNRKDRSIKQLRHYRFMVIGFVLKGFLTMGDNVSIVQINEIPST